jgi:hypothetical protein
MKTFTKKTWASAAIYFYAATAGTNGGVYQLDDVALEYSPGDPTGEVECVDPEAPDTTGDPIGPEMLVNGDFNTGVLTPWGLFGQITSQIAGGVFEFFRPAGTPAGVVLQRTGDPMATGDIMTATFQLGNSSIAKKRVTVLLHDNSFVDLAACTFWLEPGQPMSNYEMRTYATVPLTDATLSVYGANVNTDQWIRLDNASFRKTPGAATSGTNCVELGAAGDVFSSSSSSFTTAAAPVVSSGDQRPEQYANAAGFVAVGVGDEPRVLQLSVPFTLPAAASARLAFESWLTADADGDAEVQVSADGHHWITVASVERSHTWEAIDVDLSAFAGEAVSVRFVLRGGNAAAGPPIGRVRGVAAGRRP